MHHIASIITQSNRNTSQIQLLLGTEGNIQTGPDSPSVNTRGAHIYRKFKFQRVPGWMPLYCQNVVKFHWNKLKGNPTVEINGEICRSMEVSVFF